MSSEVSDKFWLEDPLILITFNRLTEFWISSNLKPAERLNAVTRLGIYLGIILAAYNNNWKYLIITIIMLIFTFFIYRYGVATTSKCPEDFTVPSENMITIADRKKFKTPTLNNPYMNSSVFDLQDPEKHKRAIPYPDNSYKSLAVKDDIAKKFNYNIYEEHTDNIYGSSGLSQRFYTMPAEMTAYDKDNEFRTFLFGKNDSSKSTSYKSRDGGYVDYGRS